MENNRRYFLRKGASLAALSFTGLDSPSALPTQAKPRSAATSEFLKDAGMQMCLAYFWGIEVRKAALARQMNVLGAVGGINPRMKGQVWPVSLT